MAGKTAQAQAVLVQIGFHHKWRRERRHDPENAASTRWQARNDDVTSGPSRKEQKLNFQTWLPTFKPLTTQLCLNELFCRAPSQLVATWCSRRSPTSPLAASWASYSARHDCRWHFGAPPLCCTSERDSKSQNLIWDASQGSFRAMFCLTRPKQLLHVSI